MIRRSRWVRPFVALFAVWFAFGLGDPGMLHSCPMHGDHGGAAPASASAGHDGHAMGMHGMRAMHGSAAESASQPPAGSPQQDAHGGCTCIGNCCAASVAAPLRTAAALYVPASVAEVRQPLAAPRNDAPASADTRLPFANGPPIA
jgi:hypothetical protein